MTKIKCGECGKTYHIKKKNIFDGSSWNFDYLMELGWRAVANKDGDGGYYICPKCRKELENKNLDKKKLEKRKMIKIKHGIIFFNEHKVLTCRHRSLQSKKLHLPDKFVNRLRSKSLLTNRYRLEFTVGYDEESKIWAIAIVHSRANFCRRIGRDVAEGRVRRMKGLIPNREPYNPVPDWIYLEDD